MAKSKVEVSYGSSSEEEDIEDGWSDTTADDDDDEDDGGGLGNGGNADETGLDMEEVKTESDGNEEIGDEIDNAPGGEHESSDDGEVDGELESGDDSEADGEHESGDEDDIAEQKSGLADVMAKILRKQAPADKPVILSKALSDKQLRLKRKIKEEQSDALQPKKQRDDSSSDDEGAGSKDQRLKKKAWEELGRRKVDITRKEPEKVLQRTATKGVLMLFNAVSKQQKILEDKLREVGSSERRKDHVIKSMTKGAFLDMLKTTPNVCVDPTDETHKKLVKTKPSKANSDSDDSEEEVQGKPSWGILRDDFMMGAKMKDWDKESEDEGEEQMGDADSSDDQS